MAAFNKPHTVEDLKLPKTRNDIDDNFDAAFRDLRDLDRRLSALLAGGAGIVGPAGPTGQTIFGNDGSDGEDGLVIVGPRGLDGRIGPMGLDGRDGEDAADLILPPNPFVGTFDAGNSGTTKTIDWNNGSFQYLTLTGNVTITLTNPIDGRTYTLILATGAGAFTAAWADTIRWQTAAAPVITVVAARYDIITLRYPAVASAYMGSYTQNHG